MRGAIGAVARGLRAAAALALVLLLGACTLPPLEGRSVSQVLPASQARETALGRAVAPLREAHPGASGLHVLADPREAFAARVQMAHQAQRTLDVQYYIWRGDTTGTLLLEALRTAADRGVRVRLLLDDNGIAGLDEALAILDAHPQVEVRLFNPFLLRAFKPLGYVTDFGRANRRMHNKSFTADNAATVVGGRNVGDEYFGATDGVLFADLDLLAVGPAAEAVSDAFDAYWRSASAYPIDSLVARPDAQVVAQAQSRAALVDRSPAAAEYKEAVRRLPFVDQLVQGTLPLLWAPAKLLVDDPAKGLALAQPEELLLHHMGEAIGEPLRSLDLVSPYFVPTDQGTDYFVALAAQGVRVRILTNSMAATDVLAVHSGYARHRERLLRGGVTLFELKPDAGAPAQDGDKPRQGAGGLLGSSGSSLHAKTFGVDGARVFVGSFNFDPRSARLNTELGLIVDSPELARRLDALFTTGVPAASWQVVRDPASGALRWVDAAVQPPAVLATEPATRWWQRAAVALLALLPLDPLL